MNDDKQQLPTPDQALKYHLDMALAIAQESGLNSMRIIAAMAINAGGSVSLSTADLGAVNWKTHLLDMTEDPATKNLVVSYRKRPDPPKKSNLVNLHGQPLGGK